LKIKKNGRVSKASVSPASFYGTPTGQCLASVAKSTQFPTHPNDAFDVTVPLAVGTRKKN
jgi:hypothetical protein